MVVGVEVFEGGDYRGEDGAFPGVCGGCDCGWGG